MNRIKELRTKKGVTISELSEITGISQTSLTNYENNKRKPRSEQVWKTLANYFDVSVGYLMGLSERDYYSEKRFISNNNKDEIFERLNKSTEYDHYYGLLSSSFEILSDTLLSELTSKENNLSLGNSVSSFSVAYDFILRAHGPNYAEKLSNILRVVSDTVMLKTNMLMEPIENRHDLTIEYAENQAIILNNLKELMILDCQLYTEDSLDSHKPFFSDL